MFRIYSPDLLQDCFATIDCMSQYSNTLGLVVANGALSTIYSTAAAPMIKTVIRDVKSYMATAQDSVGQRQLPVGYSASNSRLILKSTFDYFTSGDKQEAVDFFCVRSLLSQVIWSVIAVLPALTFGLIVCQLQLVWSIYNAHFRL